VTGLLLFLLAISVVIFVHEWGHYFAMRRNGVKVVEFTIGFGPTIWSKRLKSGTVFSLKAILLGGYTKPVAEGPESVQEQSDWRQFKIFVAGMFMNATVAFVLLTGMLYYLGRVPEIFAPYLSWAPTWLQPLLAAFAGSYGLWIATPPLVVVLLVKLGSGFFAQSAGPIGIVAIGEAMAQAAQTPEQLILAVLNYLYILNVAIAGFNLMPLFFLDGGHITEILLRRTFKPDLLPKILKVYRISTGLILLLLFVIIMTSDVLKHVF